MGKEHYDSNFFRDIEIYKTLKLRAIQSFNNGEIEKALEYVYLAATYLSHICLDIWCDNELENLLSNIGKKIISRKVISNNGESPEDKLGWDNPDICFLATNLYSFGGHTVLLKSYVRILIEELRIPPDRIKIYLTNATNSVSHRDVIVDFSTLGVSVLEMSPHKEYSVRIENLSKKIIDNNPAFLFLFIHPEDIVAITSILGLKNNDLLRSKVYFVNHADHRFWLGVSALDGIIEFREIGATLSYYKRNIRTKPIFIVPLSINFVDNDNVHCSKFPRNNELDGMFKERELSNKTISLSVGTLYKVLADRDNYFRTILEILKRRRNHYHVFITQTSLARRILKRYSDEYDHEILDRFILMGPIPHNMLSCLYKKFDFLIETFPLTGGTVRYEAAFNKLPIVAFKNDKIPFLSDVTYLPDDYPFIATNPKDVIKHAITLIDNPEIRSRSAELLYRFFRRRYNPKDSQKVLSYIIYKDILEVYDIQRKRIKYILKYGSPNYDRMELYKFSKNAINFRICSSLYTLRKKTSYLNVKEIFDICVANENNSVSNKIRYAFMSQILGQINSKTADIIKRTYNLVKSRVGG